VCVCVCVCVRACVFVCVGARVHVHALVVPEPLCRFNSHSVFKSLYVIVQHPVNINILAPKTRALKNHPQKHKMAILMKTVVAILIKYQ
jgi:hypothetical protein